MINVLFEVWLLCCCKGDFPGPPLWKTLQQVAYSWRHNEVLVGHWFQMNKALTLRLVAAFNQYSKADVVSCKLGMEVWLVVCGWIELILNVCVKEVDYMVIRYGS